MKILIFYISSFFIIVAFPFVSFSQIKIGPSITYGQFFREISPSIFKDKSKIYKLKDTESHLFNGGIKIQYELSKRLSFSLTPSYYTKAETNNQVLCLPSTNPCSGYYEGRIYRFSAPFQIFYNFVLRNKTGVNLFIGINPYYDEKKYKVNTAIPISFREYFIGFGTSYELSHSFVMQGNLGVAKDVVFPEINNINAFLRINLLYSINK